MCRNGILRRRILHPSLLPVHTRRFSHHYSEAHATVHLHANHIRSRERLPHVAVWVVQALVCWRQRLGSNWLRLDV